MEQKFRKWNRNDTFFKKNNKRSIIALKRDLGFTASVGRDFIKNRYIRRIGNSFGVQVPIIIQTIDHPKLNIFVKI